MSNHDVHVVLYGMVGGYLCLLGFLAIVWYAAKTLDKGLIADDPAERNPVVIDPSDTVEQELQLMLAPKVRGTSRTI